MCMVLKQAIKSFLRVETSEVGEGFLAVTHGVFFFRDLDTVGWKSIMLNLGNLCL